MPLQGRARSSSLADEPAADDTKSFAPKPLNPGANDALIAGVTAQILQKYTYLHLPFDDKVSGKFLDLYINTLDPQHIHFLQSDLADFDMYRTNLGMLTLKRRDAKPAYVIYNRFIERLEQRSEFAKEWLKTGPFDFTAEERMSSNRKKSPFPKDLAEAHELWRQRVRYEYLQEKLNKESGEAAIRVLFSRHDPVAIAATMTDFHQDIVKTVSRGYNRVLRNFHDWESDKVLEIYLTALAHVYDPHSDYFDQDDYKNFEISMSLQLEGVGAQLVSEDGYCKIYQLIPGGPAANSNKVKVNDKIIGVAQGDGESEDVVDMPLNKVVDKIRGAKGTEVRLTIIPADAVDSSTRNVVTLTRDKIKLEEQRAKAKIIDMPNQKGESVRLGVIELPSFYSAAPFGDDGGEKGETVSTTLDVERLLTKLKKEHVAGVVLDLRNNGGGLLDEAVKLTGLFIKDGPVVQIRNAGGETQVDSDTDPAIQYDGPLIVLTSRFSASASEILAGALQDYGRALLVGDKSTHGKGTVQSLEPVARFLNPAALNDLSASDQAAFGALKLTTRKFYRASGASTELKGVEPEIVLPSVDDYLEVGESSLENALPWDTIDSAQFDKVNRVQPYLAELAKRSSDRVSTNRDYAYVREDIEQVKKTLADKNVSLNEADRLKEKEEADKRRREREKELKSRILPPQTTYDITLKDINLPGLPPPVGKTNLVTAATGDKPLVKPGNGALPPVNTGDKTNAIASDSTIPAIVPGDLDTPEEKTPVVDANLDEATRILLDYIGLMNSNPSPAPLTAGQPAKSAAQNN